MGSVLTLWLEHFRLCNQRKCDDFLIFKSQTSDARNGCTYWDEHFGELFWGVIFCDEQKVLLS